jgi:hypothetical protein
MGLNSRRISRRAIPLCNSFICPFVLFAHFISAAKAQLPRSQERNEMEYFNESRGQAALGSEDTELEGVRNLDAMTCDEMH